MNIDIRLELLSYFVENSRMKWNPVSHLNSKISCTIGFFQFSWVKSKLGSKISKQQWKYLVQGFYVAVLSSISLECFHWVLIQKGLNNCYKKLHIETSLVWMIATLADSLLQYGIISFSILCQLRFPGIIEGVCLDGKRSLWHKYSRWRFYPIRNFYSISWTNKELNIAQKRNDWDRKSIVILEFFQYVVLSLIRFLRKYWNEYEKQGLD